MPIFHSKHQKLILQCYPQGKVTDKKPNPSELSYLLYYASTRRVKLEKVATFLERKTNSDARHIKTGNLQVTLSILSALIQECSDNLNVFATYVCSILRSALQIRDLSLCKHVLDTYGILCSKLDGGLFSGDKEFVDSFSSLSQELIGVGTDNVKAQGPNKLEWRMISLVTCRKIFYCLGYNIKFSKKFIEICIPILTDTIAMYNKQGNLLALLKSNVNVEDENHHLSRTLSTKTTSINKKIQADLDNESINADDINDEALRGLNTLFNTSLTSQISEATKAIVRNNQASGIDRIWGSTFLEMCTTWIPVQLRFITLGTLLNSLSTLSKRASKADSYYDAQNHYATYCLGLVSSEVNMIGLSISDVIQQVLDLKTDLLLVQSEFLTEQQVRGLSLVYSDCLCNLVTHIYYFDQVPDSVREIFIKIVSVFESSFNNFELDSEKVYGLIITLLEDISIIFNLLQKKTSNISRNHVNLEDWDLSLTLLSPETEFGESGSKNSKFSHQQIDDIQQKYLIIFQHFLNNELTINDEAIEGINGNGGYNAEYLQPDYNNYISDPENFVSHLLSYVDKHLSNTKPVNIDIVSLIGSIFKDMISILGINFINNFIPFFFHWQLPLNPNLVDEHIKIKDTIAYSTIYYSLTKMDDIYELQYVLNTDFLKNLLGDINYRKLNNLWTKSLDINSGEDFTSNSYPLGHIDANGIKFNPSRKNMEEFALGNQFTLSWIDPHRPLILDVVKGSLLSPTKNGSKLLNNASSFSSLSERLSNHTAGKHNALGLGLGNANDISSIHSGLLFNYNQYSNGRNTYSNGNEVSNGSVYTGDKPYGTPRVSDLKDTILQRKKPSMLFNDQYSTSTNAPGSILSKKVITSDLDSILGDLDSDDSKIVV